MIQLIPDDPIISAIERTGYPPWMQDDDTEDEPEDEPEDEEVSMKGIVVTTDNRIAIKDFDEPLHKSLGAAVGGYIETVRLTGLAEPYIMIVNEEGLLRGLPESPLGCLLYGTHIHGQPIVGDLVIMKIGWKYESRDIVGLDALEAQQLYNTLLPHVEAFRDAEDS